MPAVERFEDLIAWQKARALAAAVYLATREDSFRKDFGLASQIQRSAVSVMANIAEGFERRRRTEFFRFLEIAKGSCAEVSSHLYVAFDVGYVAESQFLSLLGQASELQRILGGLKASVARSADAERGGPQARASGLGTRNS
ncbi:MAG TPA: four helix bundle protein [Tepidiformaceae bacterium]|jgi:four helix bundle protein|nr:four helix bundle protein [Tepidiformaceae bacterium]